MVPLLKMVWPWRRGAGNLARGVRRLIEEDAGIAEEDRPGPEDRQKK